MGLAFATASLAALALAALALAATAIAATRVALGATASSTPLAIAAPYPTPYHNRIHKVAVRPKSRFGGLVTTIARR